VSYNTLLYKIASILSPNFYKEISDLLSNKSTLTIFDVGFYNGEFTKNLVENLQRNNYKNNIEIYSFDPNHKIDRSAFNSFAESRNLIWKHFNDALGDKVSSEKFTTLKNFPSSGSSVNNILVNSLWLKTRRVIFSPFTKKDNITETYDVNQKTIDSLNLNLESLDILKIDVEGYSYQVLLGAKNTIAMFKPVIQLEILSRKKDFIKSREEILNLLNDLGYTLQNEKKHLTTHVLSDVMCVDLLFLHKHG